MRTDHEVTRWEILKGGKRLRTNGRRPVEYRWCGGRITGGIIATFETKEQAVAVQRTRGGRGSPLKVPCGYGAVMATKKPRLTKSGAIMCQAVPYGVASMRCRKAANAHAGEKFFCRDHAPKDSPRPPGATAGAYWTRYMINRGIIKL